MTKIRCFVAMPFGRKDTDHFYDTVVVPVVRSLGFTSIRIDRINHNDRVDFKIRSEIERADILVADLTYARPSVYWEAGYAERKIPVIYTCRKDHFKGNPVDEDPSEMLKVHFDLANAPIIAWSGSGLNKAKNELQKRLKLVSKPILSDRLAESRIQKERAEFTQASAFEKTNLINDALAKELAKLKYLEPEKFAHIVPGNQNIRVDGIRRFKKIGRVLIITSTLYCRPNLSKDLLNKTLAGRYSDQGMLSPYFTTFESLPKRFRKTGKSKVEHVRNVWITSSLANVSLRVIEAVIPGFRRNGDSKTFYRLGFSSSYHDRFEIRAGKAHLLPSSCEVIFLDNLLSVSDLKSKTYDVFEHLENSKNTIVFPTPHQLKGGEPRVKR